VLAAGGHNAGIVSEPGHANRYYRKACRAEHSPWVAHEAWQQQAPRHEGSWWTAWHQWLAAYSGKPVMAKAIAAKAALEDAPGEYVMQRHGD
jgi:polyhydroxyalkanoate synthase subunit PhaC